MLRFLKCGSRGLEGCYFLLFGLETRPWWCSQDKVTGSTAHAWLTPTRIFLIYAWCWYSNLGNIILVSVLAATAHYWRLHVVQGWKLHNACRGWLATRHGPLLLCYLNTFMIDLLVLLLDLEIALTSQLQSFQWCTKNHPHFSFVYTLNIYA